MFLFVDSTPRAYLIQFGNAMYSLKSLLGETFVKSVAPATATADMFERCDMLRPATSALGDKAVDPKSALGFRSFGIECARDIFKSKNLSTLATDVHDAMAWLNTATNCGVYAGNCTLYMLR